MVLLSILGTSSLACQWSTPTAYSSAPSGDEQDIDYLRALAYNFYLAAGRQDIPAIVRLMDSDVAKKYESCQDLADGFSNTHFSLTGFDKTSIQVTIFPQTYSDKSAGIRRAWTRNFTAKISVDGSTPTDIKLGQDKFINRGNGWKLSGFYITKEGNTLPYPFTCGRTGSNDWY
jgi:hypothetical protein